METEMKKEGTRDWGIGNGKHCLKASRVNLRSLFIVHCSLFIVHCSLFLSSCFAPNSPAGNSPAIPPGMGAVSLVIGNVDMRTVKPADGTAHFKAYTIVIRNNVTNVVIETVLRTPGDLATPISLEPGTYWVDVTAYADAGRTQTAAFTDPAALTDPTKRTTFTIVAGVTTPVTVIVKLTADQDPSKGNGTFTWGIDLPPGLNTATMKIQSYPNGIDIPPIIDLLGASTPDGRAGSLSLAPGYYRLLFTLEKPGRQPVIIRDILHIYPNLESNHTQEFTDAHLNNILYEVTFNYENGETAGTGDYLHGEHVTNPGTPPTAKAFTPVAGLYPGDTDKMIFDGWFSDSTLLTAWNFATDVVTGNMTLYAKWISPVIDLTGQSGANDVERAIAYFKANTDDGDEYTLLVDADVDIAPQSLTSVDGKLTITGLGGEKRIGLSSPGKLFFLAGTNDDQTGSCLELVIGNNITLAGRSNNDNEPLISIVGGWANGVAYGTAFTMLSGSKITGNSCTNGTSAVWLSGGLFTMEGGTITGNTSSGDYASATVFIEMGVFEMRGDSSIKNNTSLYGDVSGASSAPITLSGNAEIGIYIHAVPASYLNIENNWNGSITSLNLLSCSTSSNPKSMTDIIGEWEGKLLLQGGGVNSTSIGRIGHGEFILYDSSGGGGTVNVERQPIAGTHKISNTGADMGKLVIKEFLVATIADLQKVGTGVDGWTLAADYKQTANIDISSIPNWTPIGDNNNRFTGSYDGDGHIITGLRINTNGSYQGLFGYISGKVENLGLIDVTITVSMYTTDSNFVGGIAGYIGSGSTIQNCYVTGTISGPGKVGGIAGHNYRGTIQDCYFIGSVTANSNSFSGGIAGSNSGTIQNCYANGSVTGSNSFAGGITGQNYTGTIQNCYFTGSVAGTVADTYYIGGIAGENDGSGAIIQDCYAAGSVEGTYHIGGITGINSGTIQNCYAAGSVEGSQTVGGIVGRNESTSRILNCVALNESVTLIGTGTYIGRITGTSGTLDRNYAWSGMTVTVNGNPVILTDDYDSGKDGTSITAVQTKTDTSWTDAGRWNTTSNGASAWDFTGVWQWDNTTGMPSLRGVGGVQSWPGYLHDSRATITLSVAQITKNEPVPDITSITLSRSNAGGVPDTYLVEIQNPLVYDAGSISWKISGVGTTYAGTTIAVTGSSFTLNANDERYNSLGGHTLRLYVEKDEIPYMVNINFTIVN